MQSKLNSLREVIITSIVKFAIVTLAQILYFKYILGVTVTFIENMGWAFTALAISLIISYIARRYFN